MGQAHEAEARVDHQRRAGDEQRVGAGERLACAARSARAGTFSPKKTTSGLSRPPHRSQRGAANDSIDRAVDIGIAVRSRGRLGPPGPIGGSHGLLKVSAAGAFAAAEADDDVETAVEVEDGAAAGALVQAVDVLRDELDAACRRVPRRQTRDARRSARRS